MGALLIGFGLGFAVGAQFGPLSMFLVRCTLRGSLRTGLAVACAVALVDTLYAAAGAAGAAQLLRVDALRIGFGIVGAVVLVAIGARTLWSALRVRMGSEADEEVATPRRAFLTGVAATASNPLTIASWAAVFTAASVASAAGTGAELALLVAGVGLGSLAATVALACATAVARRRVGPRTIRAVDLVTGAALVLAGAVFGVRTASVDDPA